jgi:2'-5' RNA ligase
VSDDRGGLSRGERLFISLNPPEEVRTAISAWGWEVEASIQGARPVHRNSIHLTLTFLGYRSVLERDAVMSAIGELTGPSARLRTAAPVWLPRRRPRVLAVEVSDPEGSLRAIRDQLLKLLEEAIGWKPERPDFLPHLTAIRLGRGVEVANIELPPLPVLPFEAREVVLYRSTLEPSGARYEVLGRFVLGSTGAA